MTEQVGESYLNHYEKYLGDFVDVHQYGREDTNTIQFLEYRNVFEGCITYMTLGLSNYADVIQQNCEIALVVDDCYGLSVDLLANVLFYIIDQAMQFGAGVHIGGLQNVSNQFVKKTKKNAIYFTYPTIFPSEFANIDEIGGAIYMAFFISQEEYSFIEEQGAERFEDLLENCSCDVFDVKRKSMF